MVYKCKLSDKAFFSFNGAKYMANQGEVETYGDKNLEAFLDDNPFWEKVEGEKKEAKKVKPKQYASVDVEEVDGE